jgi:uncharacterized membrane protein YgcG
VRQAYLAALAASALLALPWPALGQAAPQPPSGTEVTVTTDFQGRTVTVERTLANGHVTQEQVTVRSSSGQLLSRTTTAFDPATGQPVARETVTVSLSGSTVTTTEEHIVNNQVVSLEITTTTVANGQKTTVEREFALVNGALTQVSEKTETERADSQDDKAGTRKTEDDDRRNSTSQRSEDDHGGGSTGSGHGSDHGGSDHGGGGEHESERD